MISAHLWKKGDAFKAGISRADMLGALQQKDSLLWVDLESPTEFESDSLVEIFNFHPLAVEDCLVDHSQPKADDYEEYFFIVMHAVMMVHDEEAETDALHTEELDIFAGKNYIVTFHKTPVRTIAQTREAVLKTPDRYMGHGADMLLHAIIDRLVDNYQPVLDAYDGKIDDLEEDLFSHSGGSDFLSTIVQVKRDIFNLRRIVTPQRDTVNFLTRNSSAFIKAKNIMYFRDICDHLIRIYSIAEGFHESLASLLQAYFSYSSQKLNEIIKHMTVLATLTMPSIIVASIYGMNFKHMPELNWQYGYLFALALSGGISVTMLVWMKWKKWL